jgi:hypothetical protein
MEQEYWLSRTREAKVMARQAASAETRLIHLDLAGRYSIQAATCVVAVQTPNIPSPLENRSVLRLFK